jgi:ribosomal protein S12 methylthiotransferase accessory factor
LLAWTTNGCAAHWTLEGATRHALLEVVERDHLARALPRGWTPALARARRLDPAQLGRPVARLVSRFTRAGVEAAVFDLRPNGAAAFVAGALIAEPGGPVPLAAGYAARDDAASACLSALHEAAQTRLTDIHGAREDVASSDSTATLELGRPRARSLAQRPFSLRALERLGVRQVARVVLAGRGEGVYVTRVLVPGMLLSELL